MKGIAKAIYEAVKDNPGISATGVYRLLKPKFGLNVRSDRKAVLSAVHWLGFVGIFKEKGKRYRLLTEEERIDRDRRKQKEPYDEGLMYELLGKE